jgi:hypothetical protein
MKKKFLDLILNDFWVTHCKAISTPRFINCIASSQSPRFTSCCGGKLKNCCGFVLRLAGCPLGSPNHFTERGNSVNSLKSVKSIKSVKRLAGSPFGSSNHFTERGNYVKSVK